MENMTENETNVENFEVEDLNRDPEEVSPVVEKDEYYAIVRDEGIYGICKSRSKALELMNNLADQDMEDAPTNELHRREYDELNMTVKIYAQGWTLAVFPYEHLEHHYFVTPVEYFE